MTLVRQSRDQFVEAFGRPHQRPNRIAQARGLDKTTQIPERGWFVADHVAVAAARPSHAARRQRRPVYVNASAFA